MFARSSKIISARHLLCLGLCLGAFIVGAPQGFAQSDIAPPSSVTQDNSDGTSIAVDDQELAFTNVRVLSAWQLAGDNMRIHLWGVEPAEDDDAVLKLKARTALSNKIANGHISCRVRSKHKEFIVAQCEDETREDLSMYMIRQGFVTALRSVIYKTMYETPYITAEEEAQTFGAGIWQMGHLSGDSAPARSSKNFFLAAILFLVAGIGGLGFISFHIMRGFGRVVDVQNKTLDLAVRERHIKDKERFVIAAMLDAEIRENKSKIDAYLVVYEEVLRDLKDPTRTPKYKKSGDIIQKQPALGRSVFDGNTDRLDLMGQYMASDIIHYYARIKTVPDYVDLEPETQLEEACRLVQTAVDHAQKLNDLSNDLTKKFVSSGLIKRDI